MTVRFLEKNEYGKTFPLYLECFAEGWAEGKLPEEEVDFIEEYYGEYAAAIASGKVPAASGEALAAICEDSASFCTASAAVNGNRIAVLENDAGEILSMVHIRPMKAVYRLAPDSPEATSLEKESPESENPGSGMPAAEETISVRYLMAVATKKACRHRGYMDRVMGLVLETLTAEGDPWCFLIAVDKDIYRHLGFVIDWRVSPAEQEMLYADENLTEASGKLLCADKMRIPDLIRPGTADTDTANDTGINKDVNDEP